jgi:hypothetical protein
VEALGLPKLDLLGISALTVMADAADLIRRRHHRHFDPANIPLDDPQTGDLLARGDTVGVFQCESEGARKTLRQLQAKSVRDLAVANAFFKPGPATGGMAQHFVRRYRGQEAVSFLHPAFSANSGDNPGRAALSGTDFAGSHRDCRLKLAAGRPFAAGDEQISTGGNDPHQGGVHPGLPATCPGFQP